MNKSEKSIEKVFLEKLKDKKSKKDVIEALQYTDQILKERIDTNGYYG